MITLVN